MKGKEFNLRRRAYTYALEVISFLEKLPNDYLTINKQLLRSAISVGANIAEAYSSSSKRDFANFYNYSLKSANESKFWIGLLKDSGRASDLQIKPILDETCELANILAASILTMKGKKRF